MRQKSVRMREELMSRSASISLLPPPRHRVRMGVAHGPHATKESLACRHGERFPALNSSFACAPATASLLQLPCQYLQLPRCGRLEANAFAMPRRGCSRCRSNRPRRLSTCGLLWLCAPNSDDSNRRLHRPAIMTRRLGSLRLPFASLLGALSGSVCGTSWWR